VLALRLVVEHLPVGRTSLLIMGLSSSPKRSADLVKRREGNRTEEERVIISDHYPFGLPILDQSLEERCLKIDSIS
jgi:hypothetical protein